MVWKALALDLSSEQRFHAWKELSMVLLSFIKQNSGSSVIFVLKDHCSWGNLVLGLSWNCPAFQIPLHKLRGFDHMLWAWWLLETQQQEGIIRERTGYREFPILQLWHEFLNKFIHSRGLGSFRALSKARKLVRWREDIVNNEATFNRKM